MTAAIAAAGATALAPAGEPDPVADALRVLVVEPQELLQWGLRVLLARQPWVERCIPASNRAEALERALRFSPHVALVDVFVGSEPGTLIAQLLRERCPATRVVFLSDDDGMSVRAARAAGACGLVSKLAPADSVVRAVRQVGDGRTVFEAPAPRPAAALSRREQDVLRLLANGATNPEIARRLYLSPHTVKQHTSSLYRKLGVRNRTAAAQEAQRIGYVT